MRSWRLLAFAMLLEVICPGHGTFFGGGDGCCCDCGMPMPSACGCTQLTLPPLPICPPPIPCPPPICPICQICSPPRPCPPPPVALCPPPQPIYLPSSSCSCGAAGGSSGGYATGRNFMPPRGGYHSATRKDAQISGLTTELGASPPSAYPSNLLGSEVADLDIQELRSVQNAAGESDDPALLDITNQLTPLSSTAASVTGRRARGAVVVSEDKCNSAAMRDLLVKNMEHTDPVISKRLIHKASQESMKEDSVDIVCSNAGFTYIVSTTEYCEAQNEEVICFVYKKP
ncbi:unnamed protein product [Litomosoides sigmodontis]|uniref:Ground-like domain-containing protein n=1 Tax=Litomosoides sigmodontis TaxID=42156 RepID=A0A3P6UUT9_LITSI|nr:unnamed protein product [Litomosoides sigmodontis]